MYSLDGVALANKDYVAEQYRRYQADPASVDERWAAFFAGFELANGNGEAPATLIEAAAAPGRVLENLLQAEAFEQFLQVRYPTAKRFSLEGGDSLIPMLDTLIEEAGTLGVEEIVFGMPHRGRLNVLANVIRKPYEMILAEFEGA